MTYRQGDVRDRVALEEALQGADVVVHLAFMITGAASREAIRQINVEGTLNAFRAAAGGRPAIRVRLISRRVRVPAPWGYRSSGRLGAAAPRVYAQEKAVDRAAALPKRPPAIPARALPLAPADRARARCRRRQVFCTLDRSHRLSGAIIALAGRLPLPVITLPVPDPVHPRGGPDLRRGCGELTIAPGGVRIAQRSWTRAKPSGNSVGARSTAAWRRRATR